MCTRYLIRTPLGEIIDLMGVPPHLRDGEVARYLFGLPRFNVAPTQTVPAVRLDETGARRLAALRWGLVPPWADDVKIGVRMLNARSETVATLPAFRSAFKQRRCLLPADGYYEWQKLGKQKRPHFIRRPGDGLFAFAGLWERWDKAGEPVETCTMLTTVPSESLAPVHDRMPVVLRRDDYARWLDPDAGKDELQALLRPYPEGELVATPVSNYVGNVRHEGPACLDPPAGG